MFCGNCGTELKDNALVCPNCGEKVEFFEDDTVEVQWGPVLAADLNCCTKCGTPFEDGDLFCAVCGNPIESPEKSFRVEPSTGSLKPLTSQSKKVEPIDLTERHELVILTRDEAISGCHKTVEIEGQELVIDIPPYYNVKESMYFPGYGYRDKATGKTGVLKVDFMIQ